MKFAWAAVALAMGMAASTAYGAPPKSAAKPAAGAPKPKSVGETLTGQAKADYESARVLVGDGDYAGALVKFQAAYDASKDPRLLWNVAACEKQMRHYSRTIAIVKKFAADGGALVSATEKAEAAELIKTLEPFTVNVTVEVIQESSNPGTAARSRSGRRRRGAGPDRRVDPQAAVHRDIRPERFLPDGPGDGRA